MKKNMITNLFKTDSLPILGGSGAAVIESFNTYPGWIPCVNSMVHVGIYAGIGAFVGYIIKLLLDLCKKLVQKRRIRIEKDEIQYR